MHNSLFIDLDGYNSTDKMKAVEADITKTREWLRSHGFTIVQHAPHYFDYMFEDGWGHFSISTWRYHGYQLTSKHKPCSHSGTGSQCGEPGHRFSVDAFKNARYHRIRAEHPVAWYKDVADVVRNHWAKDSLIIYSPTGEQSYAQFTRGWD